MQKTINKYFELSGVSLHNGQVSTIRVNPAPANTGILFKRIDLKVPHKESLIKANIHNIVESELCSKISNKHGHSVSTIEHLMSAFYGMGIDNAFVEVDNSELPILDGSSKHYVEKIEKVGFKTLFGKKSVINILRPITIKNNDSFIKVVPSNNLSINYTIVYDHKLINTQNFIFNFDSNIDYKNLISDSRTFGFKKELEHLRNRGLIAGGSLENAIVLDNNGIMNNTSLRHRNEFVRHKVLDFIGDIFLLGHGVKASFEIFKGGHRLTHELAKSIISDKSIFEIDFGNDILEEQAFSSPDFEKELIASM